MSSEIKDIMDLLGRRMLEGQVRGTHLGLILMYLQRTKTETMKATLSKLALICGMSKRNVRENYIEGLSEFGIIDVRTEKHDIIWNWVGIKAFNSEQSFIEFVKDKEKRNKKGKKRNE